MSGVEARIGIGVQNASRNPPVQDWINRSQRISASWLLETSTLCQSLHTRSLKMRNCIVFPGTEWYWIISQHKPSGVRSGPLEVNPASE
jgi:hypothetical protein